MVLEKESFSVPIAVDTADRPAAKPSVGEVRDHKRHTGSEDRRPSGAPTVAWVAAGTDKPAVWEAIDKVAASRPFYRSQRLCLFLRFVVERALRDAAAGLKEYPIATEVYGRPSSFDPRLDPIVRVEARRLRAKLEEYYQTEGQNDKFEITLPVGAYLPVIRRRESATTGSGLAPDPILKCIGIQPFVVDAPDRNGDLYAGIFAEIVHALYLEGLMVSILHSAGKSEHRSASEKAGTRRLHALLEGSIRRHGEDIRILTRLTTMNGGVIWCGSYSTSINGDVDALETIAGTMAADIRQVVGRDSLRPALQRQRKQESTYDLMLE